MPAQICPSRFSVMKGKFKYFLLKFSQSCAVPRKSKESRFHVNLSNATHKIRDQVKMETEVRTAGSTLLFWCPRFLNP